MNELLMGGMGMPAFVLMSNVWDCPAKLKGISYCRCQSTLIMLHVQLNEWRSDRNKWRQSWSLTTDVLNKNIPRKGRTKTRDIDFFFARLLINYCLLLVHALKLITLSHYIHYCFYYYYSCLSYRLDYPGFEFQLGQEKVMFSKTSDWIF